MVVRKGCTLKVYNDYNYTDGEYIFEAPSDSDLIIRELEGDPKTQYLGEYSWIKSENMRFREAARFLSKAKINVI